VRFIPVAKQSLQETSAPMASRIEFPPLPASVAALPFLLMGARGRDSEWDFNAALASAVASERADPDRANTRRRLAFLLCELGYQHGRRAGRLDAEMPLSRGELARALGVSLCRVKRVLALLSLSQVIRTDGERLRVIDWPRLCGVAGYECARLGIDPADDGDREPELPCATVTAAGDQACFV
jgi:hypothetical protein